jgi:hypothetical protein
MHLLYGDFFALYKFNNQSINQSINQSQSVIPAQVALTRRVDERYMAFCL